MYVPDLDDPASHDHGEERTADPEEALELVGLLLSALIAAATPTSMKYRGDGPEYRRNRRKLAHILTPLGIREPFPWSTLDQGVAAAKAEYSGSGSYERRRQFFRVRAERVNELLRTRIADQAAGDVSAAVTDLGEAAGGVLTDPAAIRAELGRIEASLPRDPSTAIGKAKNLIEATAKAVLIELGQPYNEKDDVNNHVHAAMRALGIDRRSVAAHDVDLANLMQRLNGLTVALADLRNHAGDAHGMSNPPAGLDLRHGRLAVRTAIAWSAFMLDTLHDQSA